MYTFTQLIFLFMFGFFAGAVFNQMLGDDRELKKIEKEIKEINTKLEEL